MASMVSAAQMARAANKKDLAVPKLADGVVRASPHAGAKEAYLPIVDKFDHAANLLALPNGDLLLTWYAGSGERDAGVGIAVSRLNHGSDKWTQPIILAKREGYANQNPVLWRAPDGIIHLYYDQQGHGTSEETALVQELSSSDNGQTWTESTQMFDHPGFYLRDPLVVFNDIWIFPMYQERSGGIASGTSSKDYSLVRISKDQGKTWTSCDVPMSDGLVQMSVVKLSNKHMIAFFRSRYADWIYKSESSDGCHWSAPLRTSLPNNNSSIQALRLHDGHIVIVFNNAQARRMRGRPTEGSRKVLSIALSADNGKTWPWIRDVQAGNYPPEYDDHESQEYSYPSIAQTPDGMLQMAFTFRKETIKYMMFNEQWIRNGSTVGDQIGVDNNY